MHAAIFPVHRRAHQFFLEAGAIRIRVAVNEAHDLRFIRFVVVAMNVEAQLIARPHRAFVGIAGDTQHHFLGKAHGGLPQSLM